MPTRVKVKLNIRGVNTVMKSPGTVELLRSEARQIAGSAGPGFESAVDNTHPWVARAWVRSETYAAKVAEARHKALTRAVAAASH